jgi:hypothetical protein
MSSIIFKPIFVLNTGTIIKKFKELSKHLFSENRHVKASLFRLVLKARFLDGLKIENYILFRFFHEKTTLSFTLMNHYSYLHSNLIATLDAAAFVGLTRLQVL